jgi:Recombination endonuclease VII
VQAKNRAYYRRHRRKLIAQEAKRRREKCEADPEYHEKRKEANRVYYKQNRDGINARQRLRWSTDPEYRGRCKVRSTEGNRRRKYGVTSEDYQRMLTEQEGRCAMCKRYFGEALRVDHCHRTGRVRRLLCHGCNVGFGFFGEDANALRTAADYSDEFNGVREPAASTNPKKTGSGRSARPSARRQRRAGTPSKPPAQCRRHRQGCRK